MQQDAGVSALLRADMPRLGLNFAPRSEWVLGAERGQAVGAGICEPAEWVPGARRGQAVRAGIFKPLGAGGPSLGSQQYRDAWAHSHGLGGCSCTREGGATTCPQPLRAQGCPGSQLQFGRLQLHPGGWGCCLLCGGQSPSHTSPLQPVTLQQPLQMDCCCHHCPSSWDFI